MVKDGILKIAKTKNKMHGPLHTLLTTSAKLVSQDIY